LNKQRTNVYRRRQEILSSLNQDELAKIIFESSRDYLVKIYENPASVLGPPPEGQEEKSKEESLKHIFETTGIVTKERPFQADPSLENLEDLLTKRSVEICLDPLTMNRTLSILDTLWMTNLENLEALSESIGLRAYGQRDPLIEYRHESKTLFDEFWDTFNAWVFMNLFRMAVNPQQANSVNTPLIKNPGSNSPASGSNSSGPNKVGRNDPCPCGAKREDGHPVKYKHCHGK
jgi:preprotein translocase subunit SecA